MEKFTRKIIYWSLLIFYASMLASCSFSTSDDRKSVNLILKKDGKLYLFSTLGTFVTKNSLDKNMSPAIVETTKIVEKEGKFFVQPTHLKNIVNLISGNYVLLDYKEKSFDGYVTEGEFDVYDKKYGSESTEKIGKMISTANVFITDTSNIKKYHISWQRNPNQKPLKNCVEMSLWTDKSYKPGETSVVKEKYIMIDLNTIVEYFNFKVKLDYVKDDELLYVIVK